MPNIMKEVASALGVRLGERFKVREDGEIADDIFVLRENGPFTIINGEEEPTYGVLGDILAGALEIVKLPQRPKEGMTYYYWIKFNGKWWFCCKKWNNDMDDVTRLAMGNWFSTKKELLANKDKVIKLYDDIWGKLE